MADLSKLVDELSSLAVLEASELAKLLDQKWHPSRNWSGKMLFDNKQRTRTAPMKPGETEFAFYDASARPQHQTYRDLLNSWIEEMSEDGRAEAVARFRKGDGLQYRAALAELTVHAAVVRQGYRVQLHPACKHPTRRPDFLVQTQDGAPVAFAEVTTFAPATEELSQSKRDADVYNALNKVTLPAGWRMGLDILKHGEKTPRLGKLCKSVEEWAVDAVGADATAIPTKIFDADDWSIELTLYGGYQQEIVPDRVIATAMGDARTLSPEIEIRQALELKGKRYGAMTSPYLIAVADCKDQLTGGHRIGGAVLEAVFGTEVTTVTTYSSGAHTVADRRLPDGYWGTPEEPKHRNVSGVLILPKPHLWELRNDRWQPLLVRNPWSEYPLPDGLLPLSGYIPNAHNEIVPTQGTELADVRTFWACPRCGRRRKRSRVASPQPIVCSHRCTVRPCHARRLGQRALCHIGRQPRRFNCLC
jgi:hypothetical protein